MRLDHLLSKELSEGEIQRAHPKVDQSERAVEESAKSTDCRKDFLLAVSFSGPALRSCKKDHRTLTTAH